MCFSAKISKGGGRGPRSLGGNASQVPFGGVEASLEMRVSNVQYMCMVFATSGHDARSDCLAIPTTRISPYGLSQNFPVSKCV